MNGKERPNEDLFGGLPTGGFKTPPSADPFANLPTGGFKIPPGGSPNRTASVPSQSSPRATAVKKTSARSTRSAARRPSQKAMSARPAMSSKRKHQIFAGGSVIAAFVAIIGFVYLLGAPNQGGQQITQAQQAQVAAWQHAEPTVKATPASADGCNPVIYDPNKFADVSTPQGPDGKGIHDVNEKMIKLKVDPRGLPLDVAQLKTSVPPAQQANLPSDIRNLPNITDVKTLVVKSEDGKLCMSPLAVSTYNVVFSYVMGTNPAVQLVSTSYGPIPADYHNTGMGPNGPVVSSTPAACDKQAVIEDIRLTGFDQPMHTVDCQNCGNPQLQEAPPEIPVESIPEQPESFDQGGYAPPLPDEYYGSADDYGQDFGQPSFGFPGQGFFPPPPPSYGFCGDSGWGGNGGHGGRGGDCGGGNGGCQSGGGHGNHGGGNCGGGGCESGHGNHGGNCGGTPGCESGHGGHGGHGGGNCGGGGCTHDCGGGGCTHDCGGNTPSCATTGTNAAGNKCKEGDFNTKPGDAPKAGVDGPAKDPNVPQHNAGTTAPGSPIPPAGPGSTGATAPGATSGHQPGTNGSAPPISQGDSTGNGANGQSSDPDGPAPAAATPRASTQSGGAGGSTSGTGGTSGRHGSGTGGNAPAPAATAPAQAPARQAPAAAPARQAPAQAPARQAPTRQAPAQTRTGGGAMHTPTRTGGTGGFGGGAGGGHSFGGGGHSGGGHSGGGGHH
jgi:hypothetical protein